VLNSLDGLRFRELVETDEKELVSRIGRLEKLQGGFLGLPTLLSMPPLRSKMTPMDVLTVIALNLSDCCPLLDRIPQNCDTACSLQILQS